MSPEQAVGKLDELGPATDVYSLGATLYMLLTNRPPCDGSVAEVLDQCGAARGRPHDRSTPLYRQPGCDLLSGDGAEPEDRYATPLELAADVEHWLADEPVKAYPEPRRCAVAALDTQTPEARDGRSGALAGDRVGSDHRRGAVGPEQTAVGPGQWRVGGTASTGGGAAQLADKNFQDARKAVDTYLTKVSEEKLLKEERLQPLRKELLRLALDYYEKFINERADDPSVRKDLAGAYGGGRNLPGHLHGSRREGGIQTRNGTAGPGRRVVRGIGAGRTRGPGTAGRTGEKLRRLGGVAGDHWADGKYQAGLDSYNRGSSSGSNCGPPSPTTLSSARLGDSYSMRAVVKRDTGDGEGQAADTRRAVEIFQEMLRIAPDDEATLSALAAVCRRANRLEFLLEGVRISRQLAARCRGSRMISIWPRAMPVATTPLTSASRGRPSRSTRRVSSWDVSVCGSLPSPILRSLSS